MIVLHNEGLVEGTHGGRVLKWVGTGAGGGANSGIYDLVRKMGGRLSMDAGVWQLKHR